MDIEPHLTTLLELIPIPSRFLRRRRVQRLAFRIQTRVAQRDPPTQRIPILNLTLPSDGNIVRALILETVMTFTLVYVVLATTTSKNFKIVPLAGIAIGFTLGFNVIFGGSITGGSLNPARSFGPALITWDFAYQWIYWVAPIAGGLIAAGVYKLLHTEEEQEEEKLPPK